MSDVLTDVRRLCRLRLRTMSLFEDDAVAWEGESFEPPDPARGWVRETLKPQESSLVTLGPSGRIITSGIYLVDCFTPLNDGTAASDALVSSVLAVFPPALKLTDAWRIVRILGTSRAGAMPSAEWLMVPVTVRWQSDSYNTI